MSQNGIFEHDGTDDIVILEPSAGNSECTGWINIGVHAVQLQLTAAGSLLVSVEPRGNEGTILGSAFVSKADAVSAGGINPDETNADGDEPNAGDAAPE